jgi:hypothetical protein
MQSALRDASEIAQQDWDALATSLRDLSREMLHQARVGDWDGVRRMEAYRRELIKDLFAQPTPEAVTPDVKTYITEILDDNNTVTGLAQQELSRLTDKLKTLAKRRKAQRAYGSYAP